MHKTSQRVAFWMGVVGLGSIFCLSILSLWWTPSNAYQLDEGMRFLVPRVGNWLGTDVLGRDLLSRMMIAGKGAFFVAIGSTVGGFSLGFIFAVMILVMGPVAARVARLVVDMIMIFPTIIFALVMISILGTGIQMMVLLLAIAFSPRFAYVILACVREQQGQEYLTLAQSLGRNSGQILRYHYLPALAQPLMHTVISVLAMAILSEASLSFLGLGVMPPQPSWGYALSEAKQYFFRYPHLYFAPLSFIFLTILSLNFLGYALSEDRNKG
jgi:peptide/nickel transport system permease protein